MNYMWIKFVDLCSIRIHVKFAFWTHVFFNFSKESTWKLQIFHSHSKIPSRKNSKINDITTNMLRLSFNSLADFPLKIDHGIGQLKLKGILHTCVAISPFLTSLLAWFSFFFFFFFPRVIIIILSKLDHHFQTS